jgi:hypothetical protein
MLQWMMRVSFLINIDNDDGGDFDLDFFKMNNKMNF